MAVAKLVKIWAPKSSWKEGTGILEKDENGNETNLNKKKESSYYMYMFKVYFWGKTNGNILLLVLISLT